MPPVTLGVVSGAHGESAVKSLHTWGHRAGDGTGSFASQAELMTHGIGGET